MQQALPYRDWLHVGPPAEFSVVRRSVSENSVVVFALRGCCMCHVVKLLLNGHGVNPSIFDVEEENEASVTGELSRIAGKSKPPNLPAVFVGGKLIGGMEEIMGAHISGELVPRLREAKALWL